MARKLPKSFLSTPEEDEHFAKEKAASAAEPEEEEEEVEAEPEQEAEEAPAEEVAEGEESTEAEEPTEGEEPTEDEGKPSRTVPIGALHEEREKRRQLQAKIEQMEATFQKMMERVAQGQQPPAPAPELPKIPAYEEDPVAHLKARIDQLTQLSTGTHQQIQQQTAMSKFVEALGTLENQMRTTTPDYDDAIAFAKQARYSELAALGYSPEATAEMMRQEILGTAAFCMQQGRNPVEAFYNYAKVRGWQGKNGAQPASKPTVSTTAKKLATVARAQGASRSLPRGGSAPPATRTLEDLSTMDDKDFDKYFVSVMRKT